MSELPFLMLLCAGVGIGRGFERVDRALNDRWYREYEQQAVRVLAVLILAGWALAATNGVWPFLQFWTMPLGAYLVGRAIGEPIAARINRLKQGRLRRRVE